MWSKHVQSPPSSNLVGKGNREMGQLLGGDQGGKGGWLIC